MKTFSTNVLGAFVIGLVAAAAAYAVLSIIAGVLAVFAADALVRGLFVYFP